MAIGRSSNLTSPQYARRRREQLIRQSIVASVSLLIILASVILIARLSIFQIQSVQVEGNSVTATSDVQAKIAELTDGNYLWVFPKSNVLLYPKRAILSAIKQQWFRVEVVSAGLDGQWRGEATLTMRIGERTPVYVWCGVLAPAVVQAGSGNEQCQYSDEKGYLYAEAASFSGTPYVKLYGGLAPGTSPLGAHFLASSTPDAFGSALSFVSAIGGVDFFGASFKPMALIAKENNEFEVVTAGGTRIFFTLDQDIQRSIEAFRRVVDSENLTSARVEYLDLRYGNKVYYKKQ
ncbi:MAG: hypothetical protein AAB391_01415 [Patescibacteria group bacterium]